MLEKKYGKKESLRPYHASYGLIAEINRSCFPNTPKVIEIDYGNDGLSYVVEKKGGKWSAISPLLKTEEVAPYLQGMKDVCDVLRQRDRL